MICVTLFLHVARVRKQKALRESHACNSRMSVCFLTRATCKNVRQNLIPRATAYLPVPQFQHLHLTKKALNSTQFVVTLYRDFRADTTFTTLWSGELRQQSSSSSPSLSPSRSSAVVITPKSYSRRQLKVCHKFCTWGSAPAQLRSVGLATKNTGYFLLCTGPCGH